MIELCGLCKDAIATGFGTDSRVNALWRLGQGRITVDALRIFVTFRPCGACGENQNAVIYVGTIGEEPTNE